MFHLWLTLRFVTSGRRLLNLPSMLSLIGMTTGVACLVAAMAVVSGFEATLQKSVQDVFGHILVHKQGGSRMDSLDALMSRVREAAPTLKAYTPFFQSEAIIAQKGKISFILVQGVDEKSVGDVLNFRPRLIKGTFGFGADEAGRPGALIGKGLARKFGLEPGSSFKAVLPSSSRTDSTEVAPRVKEFVVRGILDLGKNDYDERYMVTSLKASRDFAGVSDRFFSGVRLRLEDPAQAQSVALALERNLGPGFFVMHWWDVNENLFEAIQYEKPVLFVVLLLIVIAASFNISSNLFISVLRKFADISILRAMGFARKDVMRVFVIHGLVLGVIGTVAGVLLGFVLCGGFLVMQDHLLVLPADVYKIGHIGVEIRFWDLFFVVLAAILVSLISTLAPAIRGSRLSPVEGLRYE